MTDIKEKAIKTIAALDYHAIHELFRGTGNDPVLPEDVSDYFCELSREEHHALEAAVEQVRPHLGPLDTVTVNWLYENLIRKPFDFHFPLMRTRAEAAAWLNGADPIHILKAFGQFGGVAHEGVADLAHRGNWLYEMLGERIGQTPEEIAPKLDALKLDEMYLEELDELISLSKDAHIKRLEMELAAAKAQYAPETDALEQENEQAPKPKRKRVPA